MLGRLARGVNLHHTTSQPQAQRLARFDLLGRAHDLAALALDERETLALVDEARTQLSPEAAALWSTVPVQVASRGPAA